MERLLADAEKLQAEMGNTVDYDISSYSDIIAAIHTIQEDLGIANATAEEAETTITGSINTLKAAFDNLVTGLGNAEADVQGLIDNVTEAFDTVVKNIYPVVDNITAALPTAFDKISAAINEQLPGLLDTVTKSAAEVVTVLANGIGDNIEIVTDSATEIISVLISTLQELIPTVKTVSVEIVTSLCKFISKNSADIVQIGIDLITALADGLAKALPQIIPAATNAVIQIVNTLTDPNNIQKVIQSALDIILALVDGLTSAQTVTEFVKMAPVVIGNIVSALVQVLSDIFDFGVKVAYEIVRGISEFDFESAISDVYTKLYNIGAQLHQALTDGYNGDVNMAGLVEQYGDKTEKELKALQADIVAEQSKINAAWDDYMSSEYTSVDDYINANIDNVNGITLAALKRAAEAEGITSVNLGTYVDEKIRQLNDENANIALTISNGLYKTTTLNADYQKSVMDGYAQNAKNSSQDYQTAVNDSTEAAKTFEEAIAEQDHLLAIHQITEEQYYKNLTDILTEYEDRSSEEWWKIYDKIDGYNQKIAASNKKAEKELAKTTGQISDDFRKFYEALSFAKAKGEISDDEYIELLKAKLNSSAAYNVAAYKSYWNEITTAEGKAANEAAKAEEQSRKELEQQREKSAKERLKQQQEAANAELQQFMSNTDKLTSEYSAKLSELQKERDSFQSKLSENIFKTETVTDSRTGDTKTVGGTVNLQKKIAARKELGKYLESLVKKGIPKGMLSELAAMDPSEGLQFAKQLDGMKDDKWQSLVADYNDYEAVNKQIADQVYGPQITALNQQYASDMTALMDTVTVGAASAGAQTIKEFIKGLDLSSDDALAQINAKIAEVGDSISEAISDGSMFEDVDTKPVGASIAAGIAEGILSKSDILKRALEKALGGADIMAKLSAAVDLQASKYTPANTSTVTNNTVVNNNTYTTSPTAQNSGSGVTNLTVNLLWKDGTKLAEIVNTANKQIAITTGG